VTWQDLRNDANHNPFVQHVLGSGSVDPAWPVNGRALSLSTGESTSNSIVGDGSGGAFVTWEEDSFVKSNHVLASGLLDPTFPVNGAFARLDLSFQERPDLVAGSGNAIVAWANSLIGAEFDIFAQIVGPEGVLGVPGVTPRAITFARPSPNPARGPLGLRFTLPEDAPVTLAIMDVNGRRVRGLASGSLPAGEHVVNWDLRDADGRPVRSGVYFARLVVAGQAFTHKLVAAQ
jgi:flagellar hook capping protein FlgD